MRILVAPDSFKGSASAREVAAAMRAGALDARADATVALFPMADGGEGTLSALSGGLTLHQVATCDALGRACTARYGLTPSGMAVVELAAAAGLPQVADVPLQPARASTDGVGRVIRAALDGGASGVVLCLGGSATTDGGTGILRALGARFLDAAGHDLPPGGGALTALASIDLAGLDPRARQVSWHLACDVDNPLTGPQGAAATYGPQKGADSATVALLDRALTTLAARLSDGVGNAEPTMAGLGAAGGTPACLVACLGATLEPGARLVARTVGLQAALSAGRGQVDLLLTGEGNLDEQSLHGKVVGTLAELAAASGVPVGVVAGRNQLSARRAAAAGIGIVATLDDGRHPLEYLMSHTAELVRRATARLVTKWAPGTA